MADQSSRGIKISSVITSLFFIILGITAIVSGQVTVAAEYVFKFGSFVVYFGILLIILGVLSIVSALKNKRVFLFSMHILIMFVIITVATGRILPFITEFGQSELESYAQIAKSDDNSSLTTFDFPAKYSVLMVFEKEVNFITDEDFDGLQKIINKNKNSYVIVKNKQYEGYKDIFGNFKTIKTGFKYTLLKR